MDGRVPRKTTYLPSYPTRLYINSVADTALNVMKFWVEFCCYGCENKKVMSNKCGTMGEKNVFKEFTESERFGIRETLGRNCVACKNNF